MIRSARWNLKCKGGTLMDWYNTKGQQVDTVLSSRVRLARNLEDYPFDMRLDSQKATELIDKVGGLLEKNGFENIDFSTLSAPETGSYLEKHYVSREFANKKTPHALMLNSSCGLAIMLCEEDHMRIQCILPGLALEEAFKSAVAVDDMIDKEFPLAYDETLGYLTHCPTNLGTAMRASVMMFLPALTMAGRIDSLAKGLSKIGLTIRGFYGEGTDAQGCIYQISNQVTLGITEEDTLKKLNDVVKQITENENELRALITPEKNPQIVDKICRAEGILRHAYMLSSKEFLSYYADVRLGLTLGIVQGIEYQTLDSLLVEMMPYHLALNQKKQAMSEKERDILRAELVKAAL